MKGQNEILALLSRFTESWYSQTTSHDNILHIACDVPKSNISSSVDFPSVA